MGIRPNKSIGWGITVKGSELNENVVDSILEHNSNISYEGLIDYVAEHNMISLYRERGLITKEKFTKLDENKSLFNYVEIISEQYDSPIDFDDENWTIIFYPMVMSVSTPQMDPDKNEFKENSSPFAYAEIEHFFPESMTDLKTVSYNFTVPPFPSEYSVVERKNFQNVEDFVKLDKPSIFQEVKQCLYSNGDEKYIDITAEMAGFNNVDEVKKAYTFAPDEDVFAYAQYSGIFKSGSAPFELKPTVVYYWT